MKPNGRDDEHLSINLKNRSGSLRGPNVSVVLLCFGVLCLAGYITVIKHQELNNNILTLHAMQKEFVLTLARTQDLCQTFVAEHRQQTQRLDKLTWLLMARQQPRTPLTERDLMQQE